jgi:hypothetical integral membrane protein (TIGR02206 family)
MKPILAAEPFVWGAAPHVLTLVLLAAVAAALIWCGRQMRGKPAQDWFSRAFALAILIGQGAMQIETMLPWNWSLEFSLPLQLCDLAWMVAVVALWTRRREVASVLYFWGLTLTTQGLITPHLDFEFPSFEFIMFFYGHGAVVLAAIYLTWGVGLHPDWNDYRRTLAATLIWGVSVFTLNSLVRTNYGYLNHKPPMPSALDFLGPYPLYLVSELSLAIVLWSLMTWAWTRGGTLRESATHAPAVVRRGRFDATSEPRGVPSESA